MNRVQLIRLARSGRLFSPNSLALTDAAIALVSKADRATLVSTLGRWYLVWSGGEGRWELLALPIGSPRDIEHGELLRLAIAHVGKTDYKHMTR